MKSNNIKSRSTGMILRLVSSTAIWLVVIFELVQPVLGYLSPHESISSSVANQLAPLERSIKVQIREITLA